MNVAAPLQGIAQSLKEVSDENTLLLEALEEQRADAKVLQLRLDEKQAELYRLRRKHPTGAEKFFAVFLQVLIILLSTFLLVLGIVAFAHGQHNPRSFPLDLVKEAPPEPESTCSNCPEIRRLAFGETIHTQTTQDEPHLFYEFVNPDAGLVEFHVETVSPGISYVTQQLRIWRFGESEPFYQEDHASGSRVFPMLAGRYRFVFYDGGDGRPSSISFSVHRLRRENP